MTKAMAFCSRLAARLVLAVALALCGVAASPAAPFDPCGGAHAAMGSPAKADVAAPVGEADQGAAHGCCGAAFLVAILSEAAALPDRLGPARALAPGAVFLRKGLAGSGLDRPPRRAG